MASIIDSLIVTLGLDPSAFKKGEKEAAESQTRLKVGAEKSAKDIAEANKRAGESVKRIKDEVLSLTAVLLGGYGIKEFVDHMVKSDAAVGRLAKNLNISTEELSAWEGVAAKFGSSSKGIDEAFRNISHMMAEYNNQGDSAAFRPLERAGVNIAKFVDKALSNVDRMKMIQQALSKLSRERAQYLGQDAGFGENEINMLVDAASKMDDLIAKQKKRHVLTQEETKAAEELEGAWADVRSQMDDVGQAIWDDLEPAVEKLVVWLDKFLTMAKQHMPVVEALVGTLSVAFAGLAAVKFGGLIAGLVGVEGAAVGAIAALGPVATAIVAIAAIAGTAWGLSKVLQAIAPNHKAGDVDPDTGNVWEAGKGRGGSGGHWVDKGGKPTRRWQSTGHSGYWVDIATGKPWKEVQSEAQAPTQPLPAASPSTGSAPAPIGWVVSLAEQIQRNKDRLKLLQEELASDPTNEHLKREIALEQSRGQGGDPFAYPRSVKSGIAAASNVSNSSSHATTTTVHIDKIVVETQATDAKGIAKDLGAAIGSYSFTTQANTGVR